MKKYLFYSLFLSLAMGFYNCSDSDDGEPEPEPTDPINTYFKDEIKPQASVACFAGAYYHKAVTSKDLWLGIGGTIKLPTATFDEDRKNPSKPGQYLDNPSIYLGGNMGGQETDIGLTWEVVKDEQGNISAERKAFRPFMRRTSHSSGQASNYSNAPAQKEYYWYPGEEVTISIQIIRSGVLKFIVDGNGKHYESEYECAGYKQGTRGEFKRVNAIDQVSNEGKPTQATNTKVEGVQWKESFLFRMYDGKIVKAPLHTGRYTDMRCPDAMYFDINSSEAEKKTGAESVNINGAGY